MIRIIGLVAFMVALVSLSVVCLFFSVNVQRLAAKLVDQGLTSRVEPLKKFIRSDSYLVGTRMVGIIALLCFAFLLWASIRST